MHQLAFIAVLDASGKELKIPAADIASVQERTTGALVTMRDGKEWQLQTLPADVFSAIDNLWTEYTTALGDPI